MTDIKIYDNFDDMGLNELLLRGVYTYGFEKPSEIQKKAIKPLLDRKDIIAQAQSGTGKTGAFAIGTLSQIDVNIKGTQILILSPTRELAIQTKTVVDSLSSYMKINSHLLIGGIYIKNDLDTLSKTNMHILIGTPGRVLDMMKRDVLNLSNLKSFILDEADEMLSFGFKEQVYDILQFIPKQAQIGVFSATLTDETYKLAKQIMNNPLEILVKNEQLTLEGIKQYYVDTEDEIQKFDVLIDIYSNLAVSQTIIYSNSKRKMIWLRDQLIDNNFNVDIIHSDMSQPERNTTIKNFRNGTIRILLSSDILARGIDIQQVSIIINYDFPREFTTYIHRIGRSGRYGKKGVALNIVTPMELKSMRECEQTYNTQINYLPAELEEIFK